MCEFHYLIDEKRDKEKRDVQLKKFQYGLSQYR